MKALTKASVMSAPFSRPKLLEGLSFEIDELIILRNWAENNTLTLTLDLGHVENSREYEEFARLTPAKSDPANSGQAKLAQPLLTMWRTRHAIMVTPQNGETLLFFLMIQALAAIQFRNGTLELRQNGVGGGQKPTITVSLGKKLSSEST
jgi:hypothetical protein